MCPLVSARTPSARKINRPIKRMVKAATKTFVQLRPMVCLSALRDVELTLIGVPLAGRQKPTKLFA